MIITHKHKSQGSTAHRKKRDTATTTDLCKVKQTRIKHNKTKLIRNQNGANNQSKQNILCSKTEKKVNKQTIFKAKQTQWPRRHTYENGCNGSGRGNTTPNLLQRCRQQTTNSAIHKDNRQSCKHNSGRRCNWNCRRNIRQSSRVQPFRLLSSRPSSKNRMYKIGKNVYYWNDRMGPMLN